jgi:hypothetical protein
MPNYYLHVIGSLAEDDPFADESKSITTGLTEEWEAFLNSGYTTDPPTRPGFYRVKWIHPRGSKMWTHGILKARRAKNSKTRCLWFDEWYRKREIHRSGEPIPPFPG